MSPAEAGRNAVKMMLYYSILRCKDKHRQRAIALYNCYCFGYSSRDESFTKNGKGQREMLWPVDLDQFYRIRKHQEWVQILVIRAN